MHVESVENPKNNFLLLNTHLYFNNKAPFTRLIQTVVSLKFVEKICEKFDEDSKPKILFGGDFNSIPSSIVYNYITKGTFCKSSLSSGKKNKRNFF